MSKSVVFLGAVALFWFIGTGEVRAQEEAVPPDKIPKAVMDALLGQVPQGQDRQMHQGQGRRRRRLRHRVQAGSPQVRGGHQGERHLHQLRKGDRGQGSAQGGAATPSRRDTPRRP